MFKAVITENVQHQSPVFSDVLLLSIEQWGQHNRHPLLGKVLTHGTNKCRHSLLVYPDLILLALAEVREKQVENLNGYFS